MLLGYFFERNAEEILNWSLGAVALILLIVGGAVYFTTHHRVACRRRTQAHSS